MLQRLPLVALMLLTACVSSGRFKALEQRLSEVETRETQRELEVNGTLLRIEAQMAALAAGFARMSDAGADDVLAKLAAIDDRLEKLATQPRPAARPSRPVPDPTKVYAVKVAGSPVKGNLDALVTVVRAGEYACPYCEKTRATMDEILKLYGSKVRIVHLDYIVHPQTATEAAKGACAAHRQGKFWEMDEVLWEQAFKTRQFEVAHIENLAAGLGLDMNRFRADASACDVEIQQEMADLTALGVGATPAFFINGRFLSGAQPLPAFQSIIDEELKLAEGRVKKGTKPKRYYDEWVVKQGLPRLEPVPVP